MATANTAPIQLASSPGSQQAWGRGYNPVCAGEGLQLFCSSKARASNVHPARIGGKRCFLWLLTGYSKLLCYEVLPFVFDYQLKRDNSAVLVVSPLLSLMMDQVDGETAGFRYCLERWHADDVASNLAHAF